MRKGKDLDPDPDPDPDPYLWHIDPDSEPQHYRKVYSFRSDIEYGSLALNFLGSALNVCPFWYLRTFLKLFFHGMCAVPSWEIVYFSSISKIKKQKKTFFGILKVNDEKNSIRSRIL